MNNCHQIVVFLPNHYVKQQNAIIMKKVLNGIIVVLVVLFMTGCGSKSGNNADNEGQAGQESARQTLTVDKLMPDINAHVDKEVSVRGVVEHVCKHGGKRLHLMDEEGNMKIRVESGKAITQFDRALEGEEINVQGTVNKLVIDEAYLNQREQELKKEGTKHDHEEEHAENHEQEHGNMAHGVNSLEQVKQLRKQLEEGEKQQITSYWIQGSGYKKLASSQTQ